MILMCLCVASALQHMCARDYSYGGLGSHAEFALGWGMDEPAGVPRPFPALFAVTLQSLSLCLDYSLLTTMWFLCSQPPPSANKYTPMHIPP